MNLNLRKWLRIRNVLWICEGAVVQTVGSLLKGEVRVGLRIQGWERGTKDHVKRSWNAVLWKLMEESVKKCRIFLCEPAEGLRGQKKPLVLLSAVDPIIRRLSVECWELKPDFKWWRSKWVVRKQEAGSVKFFCFLVFFNTVVGGRSVIRH